VVSGFLLKTFYDIVRKNYEKFEGECRIKGELEDIAHDLEVAGTPAYKIEPIYGAEFIRHHPHRLFGEHNAEALLYYNRFNTFNSGIDIGGYNENARSQESMKNMLNADLNTDWLKKVPDEPSIIGFIKYLLKLDAKRT
jgi:hypothetical protein